MAELSDLWRESFSSFPPLRCPTCLVGILTKVVETEHTLLTAASRQDMGEYTYEPVLDYRRFVVMLRCNRPACQECVAVLGETSEHVYQGEDGVEHYTNYEPRMMLPGPPLAIIPPSTPKPVVEALRQAFSLFWADLGAAANKLRVAAERVLNDQGVKQFNRTGKRRPLPLATRIEIYTKTNADHEAFLRVLQWVGNEGSHTGSLDRDDLLTAFELMQLGLQDLYGVDYRKGLTKKAREIIARRGKPRRKPKAA